MDSPELKAELFPEQATFILSADLPLCSAVRFPSLGWRDTEQDGCRCHCAGQRDRWADYTNSSLWPQKNTTPCLWLIAFICLRLVDRWSFLLIWRSRTVRARHITALASLLTACTWKDSCHTVFTAQRDKMVNHLAATSCLAALASRACFPSSRWPHCQCINWFLSLAWCVGVELCCGFSAGNLVWW